MQTQLDALHEEVAEIMGSVEEIKERLNNFSRESEPEYDSGSGNGGKGRSSDGRRPGEKRRNSKQKERVRKEKESGTHPKENDGEGLEAVFENLLENNFLRLQLHPPKISFSPILVEIF